MQPFVRVLPLKRITFILLLILRKVGEIVKLLEKLVLSNFVEVVNYKYGLAENLGYDSKFFPR